MWRAYISLFIFLLSQESFAHFLSRQSPLCIEAREIRQCRENQSASLFSEIEVALGLSREEEMSRATNILKTRYLEVAASNLRKIYGHLNELGLEPRSFLAQIRESYQNCASQFPDQFVALVDYISAGHPVIDNEQEQDQIEESRVSKIASALLEVYRIDSIIERTRDQNIKEQLIASRLALYESQPLLRILIAKNPELPRFLVDRFSTSTRSIYAINMERTYQGINSFLDLPDETIPTDMGRSGARISFFEEIHHGLENGNLRASDHWLYHKLKEYAQEVTEQATLDIGDICQLNECDVFALSEQSGQEVLESVYEYTRTQLIESLCHECDIRGVQQTHSTGTQLGMTLGALGTGIGCLLSAPICIPAAIFTGGMVYLSYHNFQDSRQNRQDQQTLARRQSIADEDISDVILSLAELERRQREQTLSALTLAAESTILGGEAMALARSARLVTRGIRQSQLVQSPTSPLNLYTGRTLNELPTEALEIFLRASRTQDYTPTPSELATLQRLNLLDNFNDWNDAHRATQILNEQIMTLYRSRVLRGDERFITRTLKAMGKTLFPVYKTFARQSRANRIARSLMADPHLTLSASDISYLTRTNQLSDMRRFQSDLQIGLRDSFANVNRARDGVQVGIWGVALGAAATNAMVDETLTIEESFDEDHPQGMSRYDNKVELIFTSPLPHVSLRVGGIVYNYGVMEVQRYNLEEYRQTVGFGDHLSANHIRIQLNLTDEEKQRLIDHLEADVGRMYPLAMPFVDCISMTNQAIKAATGIDVPVVMDRSQALSISYYNLRRLSGDERIGPVTFATRGDPLLARAQESAVNVMDSLMFTRFAPIMIPTTPILDQHRLTFERP